MTVRTWPRRVVVSAVIVAAPVLLGRLLPSVLNGSWSNTIGLALVFAMAAVGLNVIMGYTGQISLGHAAFYGAGAFTGALITGRLGLSFIAGVIAAAAVTAAVAAVIGIVSLRVRGLYLAISTLALGLAAYDGLFKTQFLSGGSAGATAPRPVAGNFVFIQNSDYLALVFVLAIIVWHLDRNAVRSKLGRAFQAIRADEDVAATLGVDVTRYKVGAFALSGALTGIAGAAYAPLATLVSDQNFAFHVSLLFLIVVVIGGLGSRIGVTIAAISFVIFPRIVADISALADLQYLIGAVLLLVTLVRHPNGFGQAMLEARKRKAPVATDDSPLIASLPAPRTVDTTFTGDTMLSVRDMTVKFGGLLAVDQATFDVPSGKIVGLIGPNGAGKTTCFNAISGLVKPQSGSIKFKGTEIMRMPVHQRAAMGMGRTFQLLGLARDLTVLENLMLAQHRLADYPAPMSLLFTPKVARTEAAMTDAAREALSALNFERFTDEPLRNLSHGQQRLVELAAALVTSPDILLLDEPSGGMAPNAAESLAQRLSEVRDKLGRTVLLIEHHIPLVLAVCDIVHVLDAGSVLASGSPAQIVRDPRVVEAYLGSRTARRATQERI